MSIPRKGKTDKQLPDAYIPTDGLSADSLAQAGKDVKPAISHDLIIVGIIILVGTAGFALGYLAGREAAEGAESGVWIEDVSAASQNLSASAGSAVGASAAPKEVKKSAPAAPKVPVPVIPVPDGGQYVASKNGTKYYLPWCGSAKNIKEENRVWFASKQEAEEAGYEPAKTCKGI